MAHMTFKLLNKGDSVINVTESMIAVRRKNGGVDIIPLVIGDGPPRIDADNIVTISYGTNAVETVIDGEHGGVTVVTF
jgi:hypothetical protein